MIAALLGLTILIMQVPGTLPLVPSAPLPVGPRTQTTTTSGGNTTVVVMPATDAEIEHDAVVAAPPAMDSGATSLFTGTDTLAHQALQLPNFLLTRDKKTILENPTVLSLNQSIRYVGLALWFICLTLIILKHLAGPFTGSEIMDLSVALPLGIFFGALGWFNTQLLGVIIDLVGAVIVAVVNASLSQAITPGLSFNTATSLILGPLLGLAFDILALWLIFKLWLQIAWLWILTAGAPIYITVTGAPFLGRYGSHWWRNWFGTLIDPILVVIGLHLCVPWFDILQGAPDLISELYKALTMLVLISTLGWHAGAYSPAGIEGMLLRNAWRMMRSGFHGSESAGATPTTSLPTPRDPRSIDNPSGVGGVVGHSGMGGGTASSWWKTGRWEVASA